MKNIFKYVVLISVSLLLFLSQERRPQYDPWGVWNDCPVSETDRMRTFSTGKYYEVPFGMYIIKHCYDAIYTDYDFPAIAIQGEYIKIEKYEPIGDGFIFYLAGEGYKNNNGKPMFQDNTRIQVRMHFISEDECYFKYDSMVDERGFKLPFNFTEGIVYKRLKAATQR